MARAARSPSPAVRTLALLALLGASATPAAAQLVRSGSGTTAVGIQPSIDAFRADLGALNANVAGSFGTGRREINWDGVPAGASAPNALPANFFNVNSPRGVVFATPGSGFAVSANAGEGTPRFGDVDPSYPTTFGAFSPQKLFTAVGSNILDVNFFVPGSNTAALTRGFGAVFTDVDLASTTSLEFFGANGGSLGTFYAPALVGSATFSFLGVSFADAVVARVRIVAGNAALGPGILDMNGNATDLVVMDDFIYGEPVAVVPEPTTVLLTASGLAVLALATRRRVRR